MTGYLTNDWEETEGQVESASGVVLSPLVVGSITYSYKVWYVCVWLFSHSRTLFIRLRQKIKRTESSRILMRSVSPQGVSLFWNRIQSLWRREDRSLFSIILKTGDPAPSSRAFRIHFSILSCFYSAVPFSSFPSCLGLFGLEPFENRSKSAPQEW